MTGQTIYEAPYLKFVWRLHQALDAWEKVAIDELLKAQAMYADETSMRVDKKLGSCVFIG